MTQPPTTVIYISPRVPGPLQSPLSLWALAPLANSFVVRPQGHFWRRLFLDPAPLQSPSSATWVFEPCLVRRLSHRPVTVGSLSVSSSSTLRTGVRTCPPHELHTPAVCLAGERLSYCAVLWTNAACFQRCSSSFHVTFTSPSQLGAGFV